MGAASMDSSGKDINLSGKDINFSGDGRQKCAGAKKVFGYVWNSCIRQGCLDLKFVRMEKERE